MAESNLRKKIAKSAKNAGNMPEITVFVDFHRTFSLSFVVFSRKNISDIAFLFVRSFVPSFVRLFVCSFVRSFVRSFIRSFVRLFVCARSFFHYQVGPISVSACFLPIHLEFRMVGRKQWQLVLRLSYCKFGLTCFSLYTSEWPFYTFLHITHFLTPLWRL